MTLEAASALGIDVVVLAEGPEDSAVALAAAVQFGSPSSADALARLAAACDVVTFDHEQLDLRVLQALQDQGRAVHPGPVTLQVAVDKAAMRTTFAAAGIPVPAFAVAGQTVEARGADRVARMMAAVAAFGETYGWPLVLKAGRGGYDGRGVWPVAGPAEAVEVCRWADDHDAILLVEEHVTISTELAVLVARRAGGEMVVWPAVETSQSDGVCREVLAPGPVDPELADEAMMLAQVVAQTTELVGVMAVELFVTGGALVVNEVAARPHNSGHWTIEGSVTSQFENHLRAVLDLPLGDTALTAPHVACVNVFGAEDGSDPRDRLAGALGVAGAHVHLYGKQARPGRKLGHVTVCGADAGQVRARAWAAARALGSAGGTADVSRVTR
jgi:5-(carboxyamino)imidazole ribonucleotide synthase